MGVVAINPTKYGRLLSKTLPKVETCDDEHYPIPPSPVIAAGLFL